MKVIKKTIVDVAEDITLEDRRKMLNETKVDAIEVDGEFEDVRLERRFSQIKILNKEVAHTEILAPVVQDDGTIKIETHEVSLVLESDDSSVYQNDMIANIAIGPMYGEVFAVLINRNYIIFDRHQRRGGLYSKHSASEILTLMKQESLDEAA